MRYTPSQNVRVNQILLELRIIFWAGKRHTQFRAHMLNRVVMKKSCLIIHEKENPLLIDDAIEGTHLD